MKPKDPKRAEETRALQHFVDCLRGALRMAPLYASEEKTQAERFATRFIVDGVGRGVASGRAIPPHWV